MKKFIISSLILIIGSQLFCYKLTGEETKINARVNVKNNEIDDMSFGDPSSLSSVQTIVEVYNDVEINNVSDDLFKLIVEE